MTDLATPLKRRPVKFVWGRDWFHREGYHLGVFWDLDPAPEEGCLCYRKWIVVKWRMRVWLDRH